MQEMSAARATYADVLAAPAHMVAEIIEGRLVLHPRPAPRHLVGTSALGVLVGRSYGWQYGGRPGGWWIIDEPELHLGDDILVPDLAGWRIARMPALPETAYFSLVPDWVCEVISPSTQHYDKGPKRDIYAAHGVGHLWHADPAPRILETFEARDGGWLLARTWRDADVVAAPPFEAARFALGLLWGDPAPAGAP